MSHFVHTMRGRNEGTVRSPGRDGNQALVICELVPRDGIEPPHRDFQSRALPTELPWAYNSECIAGLSGFFVLSHGQSFRDDVSSRGAARRPFISRSYT